MLTGRAIAAQAVLLRVVRGESPLAALATTALGPCLLGGHPHLDRTVVPPLEIAPCDIARGLLAHRDRPEALQRWAWSLLSWDFIAIGGDQWRDPASPDGAILTALWNAAYRLPLDDARWCAVAAAVEGDRSVA